MTQSPAADPVLHANALQGRYLLFLDILGFSDLVRTSGRDEVLFVINGALDAFDRWESVNGQFQTIYFSDSFVFYQVPQGYGKWAFLDIYAIGSLILTSLLAKGIAARGAISFGEFDVNERENGKHRVYFGRALVEAYEAEQRENWIGITILPSACEPVDREDPGLISAFESEKAWLKRFDGVLLLNPFIKLRAWYIHDLIGEIGGRYEEWDAPDFPNEIRAFKFLSDMSQGYAEKGDFTSRVASKYHATTAFLTQVFGKDLYEWASKIAQTLPDTTAASEDHS